MVWPHVAEQPRLLVVDICDSGSIRRVKMSVQGLLSTLLLLIPTSHQLIEKIWEIDTCGPPKIQNTMMNQTKHPGEYAHFKCQIDMSKCMVAYIDWYHDSMNGSDREKIKSARHGDPHTHVIDRVEPYHEGLYTCVAGNVLGKAEASAYLQVYSGGWSLHLNKGGLHLLCSLAVIGHFFGSILSRST